MPETESGCGSEDQVQSAVGTRFERNGSQDWATR